MINRLYAFALALLCGLSTAQAFEIAGQRIDAGSSKSFDLLVPAGDHDPETYIPITVLAGREAGPTLLVVSGVHGYEFISILAAERLADEIDPGALRGTLVLVRAAHVAAFTERSPYVNPRDRKNLNRSFPGDPRGSQTERIAHALSTELIAKADFVVDAHSGDGAEWLEAFVGVYGGPLASGYGQALDFGLAMGFPNLVRYQMKTQEQIDRGRSLNRQAVAQGLPTVLVEIGENGSRSPVFVDTVVNGLKAGMASLGMLEGPSATAQTNSRLFDGTASVPVENTGLWHPVQAVGRPVEAGEVLGEIRNFRGQTVETVTAPVSGRAIYGLAGPPIRAGDSVMTIALPVERLDP